MELKIEFSCPLGHKCEEAKDGKINRCAWFVQLSGQNPQTGEVSDERGCAITWLPILLIENSRVSRGTSAAVESFRNEMVRASEMSQQVLLAAAQAQAGGSAPALRVIDSN